MEPAAEIVFSVTGTIMQRNSSFRISIVNMYEESR